MAIDSFLLGILCCPEDKSPVTLADEGLVHALNARIQKGELKNRGGKQVREPIAGGLVRADQKYLYPVREDIPILLIDEAIPLEIVT